MFERFWRTQPPTAGAEAALAQARQWQRWLRWMAWVVPIAISVGVYLFVWYGLVLPGQTVVQLRQATNLIFFSALASLVIGIFIYQIQLILAQQTAASAELERRVQERTRDITEVMHRLDEQNQALVALDRQKSEFVTLVSHELRAPLTNINGGLELVLSRDRSLSDQTQSTLRLVGAEASRLTRFVETILDVSAYESGQLPVVLGPVEVGPAVRHVLGQFAGAQAGQLISRLPPGLPPVLADEHYLQSVLFHLVDNALKYAESASVRVTALAGEEQMNITVRDGGPGIPAEAAARLFGKFERLAADDSQSVYGYGLGLYMCKLIMEALHGTLRLLPPDGQPGAAFEIGLPIWRPVGEGDEPDKVGQK